MSALEQDAERMLLDPFRGFRGSECAEPAGVVKMPLQVDPSAPYDMARLYRQAYKVGRLHGLHFYKGEFWVYRDRHYVVESKEALRAGIYAWMAACKTPDGKAIDPNRRMVTDVSDALAGAAYANVDAMPAWLNGYDGPPVDDLLVCQNGIVHMPSRKLLPSDPRLFASAALALDFDPNASTPAAWISFLAGLWPNDAQSIDLLQEFMGLCALTDDTRHQKALLMIGPRRSGKGTILRLLRALAGDDNVCSPTLAALGTHFGTQGLIGKRVAMVSDARLSGRTDVALVAENILRITGEDAISVPRKHREDWVGKLPTRFVLATNELPAMADASAALSSRFLVLQMTESFYGREDHGLTERLLAELPSILLWAMDGLDRLRARGRLVQPASSQEMVDELEALASPITMFIRDCCVQAPAAETPIKDLFDRWCEWCRDQGRDHPGTAAGFGKCLRAACAQIHQTQPRRNGVKVRCYSGIRLRSIMDEEADHGHQF